jgi:hypothetical protein
MIAVLLLCLAHSANLLELLVFLIVFVAFLTGLTMVIIS